MSTSERITIAPTTSRIIRRVFGYRDLESTASQHLTICPKEKRANRPPIVLEDQINKITGVHEFSAGLDDELLKTTCEVEHHSETLAFKVNNVFLTNGNLCSYKDYKKLTFSAIKFMPATIQHEYDSAAMCSTAAGNDYFAHFVFDDACTAMLGEQFGQVVFANLGKRRTEHMLSYLSLLDIPTYKDIPDAYFKELWLFKDFPLNCHRRNRLQIMREKLSSLNTQPTQACVYIKRGNSGKKRQLLNEEEIINELQKHGFHIIDPEKLPLIDLIKMINGSSIALGVEGSHLIHAVLNLKTNGTLVCIQPPDRFNAIYRPFTNAVDLNWAFVVGEGSTEGFTLALDPLMATLDKCYTQSL